MEINKIYNMDCLEGMKKHILNDSIDLVVTSPPYDNLRTYDGYSFDFEGIAKELYRVIKPGGVVVWIVADATIKGSETGTSFKQALYFKEIGFNLHDTMIYQKNAISFPNSTRYYNCFEYMFILSKGKPKTIHLLNDRKNKRFGEKIATKERLKNGETVSSHGRKNNKRIKEYGIRFNIWKYDIGYQKSTKDIFAFKHPAIFPEKLVEDHIISWSNEDDIILDPFMGSGTTAKMALLNNRNYVGFEVSEEYMHIAEKRINECKE